MPLRTALLVLALAGQQPNIAAPFEAVPNFAPPKLGFNDAQGKGFEWEKKLPCGSNHATVTVRFEKAYPSIKGNLAPVAKVWLHSGESGDPSEQWISAVLKAPTDTWKLNAMAWLEKVDADHKSETAGGFGPADLNKPVNLDFTWTRDGAVTVKFGDEFVKHAKSDKPITGFGLGGSWSKFEFIGVKVGHSGDPDPACGTGAAASPASAQIQIRGSQN
jgi:hypothetical protein